MGHLADKKKIPFYLGLTAVFNTVIALFLTQIDFGRGFFINFIFSQSIGLSMCSFILAGHFLARNASPLVRGVLFMTSMSVGAVAGVWIGALIAGLSFSEILFGKPALFFRMFFGGILFGTMISYFFFSRERISQTETMLQKEQIKGLTLEKKTLEIHLKLLQAQIEPHFLFNTLSNTLSLLESDPDKGRAMLEDLTRYLRSSLSRTRGRATTLGQEMDMIRSYLDIHRLRMGERLTYTIEVPESLKGVSIPPMLVQPLVENALRHGIEPKIDGGEIHIQVRDDGDRYCFIIADSGLGMSDKAVDGIGLSNVRERLEALFPGKGRLILEENRPTGLKVTLEIPHE